jgi:hypothetical protein
MNYEPVEDENELWANFSNWFFKKFML